VRTTEGIFVGSVDGASEATAVGFVLDNCEGIGVSFTDSLEVGKKLGVMVGRDVEL
jgi:hypothetical protein